MTEGGATTSLGRRHDSAGKKPVEIQAGQGRPIRGSHLVPAIAKWKTTPQEVARKTIAKYGQPQAVTANRLIWRNNGPWKYTELVNEEIAHDFPMPHKDMLYQAISYKIDPAKSDELL